MSTMRTQNVRRIGLDHFEPEEISDPQHQKRLRGQLEQIDYTAYVSNREVIAHDLGAADAGKFQHLAVAVAHARVQWVREALAMTKAGVALTCEQVESLACLRAAYEELTEAYEAMRRMVERGYLAYGTAG